MKNFYLTKKINTLVSTLLVLLGLKESTIGSISSNTTSLINFNTRNSFGIYSFKAALVMLFLIVGANTNVKAQTTLISSTGDGGFENGTTPAANNWTAVNSSTDGWYIGSVPVVSAGARCGYISSTAGAAWTYSQISTIQHLYYDVTIPAGQSKIVLTFKWKALGEGTTTSDWDNMKVFFGPTSSVGVPVANTGVSSAFQVSGAGAISGMYKLSSAAYNSETITLSGTPGTSYRLVFSWKSDSSTIASPPAAIDEVNMVSSTPGNITSNAVTGLWSATSTWVGGVVPSGGDNVTIANGATVTIDVSPTVGTLAIGGGTSGVLQYDTTARTFTALGDVTINSGATFRSAAAAGTSTITTHSFLVGGNLTNNGTINFSATAGTGGTTVNASGVNITFNGATDATFDCSGATLTNLRSSTGVILNKGTTSATLLNFIPPTTYTSASGATNATTTITVGSTTGLAVGMYLSVTSGTGAFALGTTITSITNATQFVVSTAPTTALSASAVISASRFGVLSGNLLTGSTAGFLSITNGTFKVNGSNTFNHPYFNALSYSIPSTGGFWLNNSNATVTAQGGSPTVSGLLRMTSGTYNVGTSTGNSMGGASTSNFVIEGGTMNFVSRFNITSSGAIFNMSGGTMNLSTLVAGNTTSSTPSFGFTSTTSVFTMSGGTINLVNASTGTTQYDWQVLTTTPTITGGTLNIGTAATSTKFSFTLSGAVPNLVINNTTNNKTATCFAATSAYGTTTINSGTSLNLNGFTFTQRGDTFTNNGSFTGTITSSRLSFLGTTAQTLAGSGTVTSNIDGLSVQNAAGLNITHANQIPTLRVNLFQGVVTGSAKLTMGTGAALAVTTQIGAAASVLAGGSFDVTPTFNLGTGTYSVLYLQELGARTSGNEIPGTRAISALTISNSNGLTIAGGNLATGTLTFSALSGGNITTSSSNLLTVTGTTVGSIVRTLATAYVNGPLAITLPASQLTGSNFTLPIGKGTLNPFVLVNPTTNAGGTVTVQAEVFDTTSGGIPGTLMGALNTNRYWAASITAGGANFTNSLLQLNDAPAGADAIAGSTTLTGAYDLEGGVAITSTATSLTSTAPAATTLKGFYVMGNKAAATITNLVITPSGNQCTNVARTVTATVTPGGAAVSTVVINYSLNGTAQTPITMTNTTGNGGLVADNWSGVIPTVTPNTATVVWSVTATDGNALTKNQAGVTYADNPNSGVSAAASASLTTVCSGSPTVLTASLSKSGTLSLGAGASTSSTSGSSMFPGTYGGAKTQYIIKASELTALGISAGNITSLAFEATTAFSGYEGFALNIGATAVATASLPMITSGLTQVYSGTGTNGAYATTIGVNTLTFSSPFLWNGTSNIVLSFCWAKNPTASSTTSTTVKVDSPGFTCSVYGLKDSTIAATMCPFSVSTDFGTSGTGTSRPRFTFSANTSPAITSVSWSDGTNTYTGNGITVNPTVNPTTYTATVIANSCPVVSNGVAIAVNPLPSAPTANNSTQCGTKNATCSVTSTTGASSPIFKWYLLATGGSAISGQSANTLVAYSVSTTTTFYVSEVGTNGCDSSRTAVTVSVNAPDAVSATVSSTSFCAEGGSVTLTAANIASTPVNNYTYSWSSTAGSGASTPVTGNPVTVFTTAPGTYIYTVTATEGDCATTAPTTSVTALAGPTVSTFIATPTVACAGSTIALAATSLGTAAGTVTVGTGTTVNLTSSTTATGYPAPFGNYYQGALNQMLIRASDLTASGLSAGNITSVAFDVVTPVSTALSGFSVSMKSTSLTALGTTLETGLTSVFAAATYTPSTSAGYTNNKITFATPFTWDGTSNIIIQTCFANTGFTTNGVFNQSTTSYVSTLVYRADLTTVCSAPGAVTFSYSQRPNMRFEGQASTDVSSNFDWTWKTGATTVLTTPTGTTILPVGATTTYDVTATSRTTPFCTTTRSVSVSTAVAALTLNGITPATATVCAGTAVTLSATPSGGCLPYSYLWSNGATTATISVTPSATTTYNLVVTDSASNSVSATSSVITVTNPQPSSVVGETKCAASATFNLSAVLGNVSNTLSWYSAITGGSPLITGAAYTTPSLSATTTYYVEEKASDAVVNGIGLNGTTVPDTTSASAERGIVFTATKVFTLISAQYYSPTTSVSNTVIVRLLDNATGTVITTKTLTIAQGATAAWYTMNLGFDITPGTYRLLAGFSQSVNRSTTGLAFPYAIGTIGSITSGYDSAVSSTTYSYFHNISIQTFCTGTRVPVVATLTPPTAISFSTNGTTICSGNTATATLTDTAGYDTFVWNVAPASGTGSGPWTFTPTVTTTYTLTASQSAGICSTVKSFTVTVNSTNVTATATPSIICIGSSTTLAATTTGLSTGSSSLPGTYCVADSSGGAGINPITSVVFGSINNATPTQVSPYYTIFPATGSTTTTVTAGQTYPLTVAAASSIAAVWIDYNRNGTFESTEFTQLWTSASSGTVNISIPSNAVAGATAMRIRSRTSGNTNGSGDACSVFGSGTSQDYTINVIGVANVTSSTSYSWKIGTGPALATTSSFTVSPTATTIYTVTATDTTTGCQASANVTVTVNSDDIQNITGGANTLCLGGGTADFNSATDLALWSSSNPLVASINADGIVSPLSVGTTTIRAYVYNDITGCTTYAANSQLVTVYAPISVTANPTPSSILPGDATSFSITASGSVFSYQWKVSTNNTSFTNLANAGVYSGVNSPTLTITGATTAVTGTYYLCEVTGYAPCASPLSSASALLTVSALSISNPSNYISCTTSTTPATFTVIVGGPADSIIWEIYDGSDWIVIDDQLLTLMSGAISFGGDVFSGTLVVNGLTTANNTWKVRANALAGETIVTSDEATITINTPASFSASPSNSTNCYSGGSSNFSITTAGGTGIQWQYSTNGSTSWNSVLNDTPTGATYTNATTSMLTVATTNATSASGTYYYRALLASPNGCDSVPTGSAQLFINTPTVSLTGSSTYYCTPSVDGVTLTATGTATTYSWSPAAGLSATTGATVIATPAVTTTYTVTGTETGGCSKTAQFTITVGAKIAATATASTNTICPGSSVQLNTTFTPAPDNSPAGFSMVGSTSTYNAITGTTLGSGAIGDDVGIGNLPIGFTFNYNGVPQTIFAASSNGYIILGQAAATITGGSSNALASNANIIAPFWDDNNTTGGSIIYATTGTAPNRVLTVQWTNMHVGGSGSASNPTISVQALLSENGGIQFRYGAKSAALSSPTASVGFSGSTVGSYVSVSPLTPITSSTKSTTAENTSVTDANLPSGSVFTFAPGFVDSYTYAWSPSDFITGQETLANPVTTAITATTTYTVVVTSSIGCSSSASTTITTQSGSSIVTEPTSKAVCVGQATTFSVVGSGSGLAYQWYKDGTAISGNASATTAILSLTGLTLSNNGSTYYAIITPSCGDTATSTTVILTVNPLPTATISGTASVCLNGTSPGVTLTGAIGTAPYTFTYKIGTGSNQTAVSNGAGVAIISAPTTASGTFVYTLVSVVDSSSTACTQTQTGSATITVNALPTAVTVTPTGSTTICSGATPVLLTASGGGTSPSAYCIPAFATVSASGDYLNNFSFAGIVNNNSGDTATDYTYYSTLTATTIAGTVYPVSLQSGGISSTFAQQFRIWVDMNQNGVFETTESVFNTTASSFSPSSATGNITIPTTALNGTTRLRVIAKYSSTPLNTEACSSTGIYGEYEDYNITISGGTSPTPVAVWTSTNGGLFTNTTGTVYNGTTARSTIFASPTASGTVTATVTNAAGCSAFGTVSFTVNPLPSTPTISLSGATTFCTGGSVTLTASTGSSYLWSNGAITQSILVTNSGNFSVQVTNEFGCLSATSATTTVTVNVPTSSSSSATACDSYTWSVNGTLYTASGTYTFVGTNSAGCTDTKTLNLTINNSTASSQSATACDSYTWSINGTSYTASGIYTNVTTNAAGCPDTKTLVLTINNSTASSQSATACDSYTWSVNGTTYSASGTYTFVGTNAAGCPDTKTLVLTINNSTASSQSATACDSYTWSANGTTYTVSGTYTNVTTNAAGCPDTKTLVLTINNSTSSSETVTSTTCGTYTWSVNGTTYTASGTYTYVSTNAAGCPDTKTLVLTITPCETVVNVKLFIEGYYDEGSHAMRPVLSNQGIGSSSTNVDNVTVELHDSSTYALVTSTTAMLQSNGNAVATFSSAPTGSFYIVIKHRNALETWSASPQTVGATALSYDFSTAANKSYGDNMKLVDGVYAIFSGDINQDGFIEATDYDQLNADNDALLEGFYTTDLNGDGFVEALDFDLINSNSDNLIESIHP